VPATARPDVVEVSKVRWDRDPKKRMKAGEIVEKLSEVCWVLLNEADPKAVATFLTFFPLTAPGELSGSLERRDRKIDALKAGSSTQKSQLSRQQSKEGTTRTQPAPPNTGVSQRTAHRESTCAQSEGEESRGGAVA
jgi:hypothetical protein